MKQVNCPSWDKLSIRNHSVPPFVIRVLCLNTLYAKGYFFNQPDILESTNLKEKTDCFYQPDNLESTNPTRYFRVPSFEGGHHRFIFRCEES